MKISKRTLLALTLLSAALLLSACSGRLGASSWPGVTVAKDKEAVYVSGGKAVFALNLADGSIRWAFAGAKKGFYAPPTLTADGNLVVGDYGGILYELTPNGNVKWQFVGAKSHYVASPLVTKDAIFAPNADYNLYALSPEGKLLWKFTAKQALWGTPAYDGKRLYVPSLDHHVYALDAATGKVEWATDLGGAVASQPNLVDGVLYAGTFANSVAALDAQTGKVLWRAKTTGWVWSAPAYADGTLFVGDLKGAFFAFSAKDGSAKWQVTPNEGGIVGKPAVKDGIVYFTTENGKLAAMTVTGKPQWQISLQGKLYSPPILTDGEILVAPYKGDDLLVALSAENGSQKWALPIKTAENAIGNSNNSGK